MIKIFNVPNVILKIPSLIHCHENVDFMQKNLTAVFRPRGGERRSREIGRGTFLKV